MFVRYCTFVHVTSNKACAKRLYNLLQVIALQAFTTRQKERLNTNCMVSQGYSRRRREHACNTRREVLGAVQREGLARRTEGKYLSLAQRQPVRVRRLQGLR